MSSPSTRSFEETFFFRPSSISSISAAGNVYSMSSLKVRAIKQTMMPTKPAITSQVMCQTKAKQAAKAKAAI